MSAPVESPRTEDAPRTTVDGGGDAVDVRRVWRLWAPLAASWLLMAMEPTLVYAAVSRLEGAKITLAAWASVVFPVSLVVEGPIIMLLAATTRLASTWDRYARVMRYGNAMSAALTALHAAIAFTPLYDWVAVDVLGSAPEVVEPGRLGLRIMLPWTFAIGYRRAQQGTLIRFEKSAVVSQGTALRLLVTASVLFGLPPLFPGAPGIAVAGLGVAAGVSSEAIFAGVRVRSVWPALRAAADDDPEPMTLRRFARFYGPLAVTPLITLLIQPIGASAMNRMPRSLDSVAAWGPIHALVFTARSVGMAFNEVVVTLVALPGGARALVRFGVGLGAATSLFVLVVWTTPLAGLWFERVQGIPSDLVPLATLGVALATVMPAYQVAQSWFQGLLVHRETTRPITEAVALYFIVASTLLWLGTERADAFGATGVAWAVGSFVVAGIVQTGWLWLRSRQGRPAAAAAEALTARTPG